MNQVNSLATPGIMVGKTPRPVSAAAGVSGRRVGFPPALPSARSEMPSFVSSQPREAIPDRVPAPWTGTIRLFTFLLLGTLAACQQEGARGGAFQIYDSAGVNIVESKRPLWAEGEAWVLSSEPEVVIGLAEGDEEYLLNDVRGVRRLDDGRIAVLDAGSFRVRVYDSTGAHLIDLGREGDGPSEFRSPQFLSHVSDTLVVYQALGGTASWFSPEGEFLRTSLGLTQTERGKGALFLFGHLGNRFGIGTIVRARRDRPLEKGINREPWSIWRYDLLNSELDSLFPVPGAEVEILSSTATGSPQRRYVFGKWTCLAASRDHIYVAPTDEYSIQVFDREGTLQRIVRLDVTPRRVTRSDFNRWVDQYLKVLDRPRAERAEMRRTAAELSVAGTMPAFRRIAVDSEEHLWVEEWKGVGLDQGRFSVFRSDGALLGHIEVPSGLPWMAADFDRQVLEIGSDYLLGVWIDDLGVEQVRLYRIEKN